MQRDKASSSRIWEIRKEKEMERWKNKFNEYLLLAQDFEFLYFNEYSDPLYLKKHEKEGSLFDPHKGILFYLIWYPGQDRNMTLAERIKQAAQAAEASRAAFKKGK